MMKMGRFTREFGAALRVGLIASLTLTSTLPYVGSLEPAYAQVAARFSRIDVTGNRRIESDTIRSIAGIRAGQRVEPAQRRLFAAAFAAWTTARI